MKRSLFIVVKKKCENCKQAVKQALNKIANKRKRWLRTPPFFSKALINKTKK